MEWVMKTLKQASTWKGLIFLLSALGVATTPEQQEAIITACLALVGAVDVFLDS